MRRKTPGCLVLLLAALPLRAQETAGVQKGPVLVSAGAVQAQVDDLRDAVASPAVDDPAVRAKAGGFFDGVPGETPVLRPAPRVMDREFVDGSLGSIDGMLDEARRRWDAYKASAVEVPDAKLDAAIAYAESLRKQRRVAFDGGMPEIQMGEFEYAKDRPDIGAVKLNARLALLSTRIGEAFCYAALVHEAAHAKARAEGRLDPEKHEIDDEVEAYRVQYFWLKAIDPRAERMIVLISTLKLELADPRSKDKEALQLSVAYLEHLLRLWDTRGQDPALRDFIRNIGYRSGGLDPAATAIRA